MLGGSSPQSVIWMRAVAVPVKVSPSTLQTESKVTSFALVDAAEEVERVFPLLASGSPAVLVQTGGKLTGIITRADLLDFVAHRSEPSRAGK